MARQDRPINAEVPASAQGQVKPDSPAEPAGEPPSRRRRGPFPTALKAVIGLVVVAIVFLVAAIVGGGSDNGGSIPGAAPTTTTITPAEQPSTTPPPLTQTAEELGYPDFATNNTTRVGGGDPAANAAAVALAVYPSTEDALRPPAVSLVDAADWQGAIAAAVLMAEPLGAPLLISEAGGLPESSAAALDALDPQGGGAAGGTQAIAIGAVAAPADMRTTAIAKSGAAAAAAIAKLRDRLFGAPPRHLVVAPTQSAFAMPAAAWAARSGDPVLFASVKGLPKPTVTALQRHKGIPAFVLGPSSTISSDVVREIAKLGHPVHRVSGEDPVANAIALARYDEGSFGWNVNDPGHGFIVARSDSPLDAAAAAPLSASGTWGPLLLTDGPDTLPAALRGYLLDVKPGYTTDPTRAFYNHVWVIGDQDAIDVNQQGEIDQLAELAKIGGEP